MKKTKGIVLYSGGLDSLLAAKILMAQDIEVIGFHAILPFMAPDLDPNTLQGSINAHQINLKLHFYRCEKEYLEVFTNPPHGYGKNINPCIDCHIFFLKKAAEYMEEIDADFIATGEVVGQRPMSQLKNMLIHIERASDLEGRLIRPLSAKILNPTIPEQEGLIDREKLYDISGRSRKQHLNWQNNLELKSTPLLPEDASLLMSIMQQKPRISYYTILIVTQWIFIY